MIDPEIMTILPGVVRQGGEQLRSACDELRSLAARRGEAGAEFGAELMCMEAWWAQGPSGVAEALECGNRLLALEPGDFKRYSYAGWLCLRTPGGLALGLRLVDIGMAGLRNDTDVLRRGEAAIAVASIRFAILTAMDAGSAQAIDALGDLSSMLVMWRVGAEGVLDAIERVREAHGGSLPEEAGYTLRSLWQYFAWLHRADGRSMYHDRIESLIESIVIEDEEEEE